MRELGISLIVGGTAFLLSGLVFLLPQRATKNPDAESVGRSSTWDR
jgi:hypothetical protein